MSDLPLPAGRAKLACSTRKILAFAPVFVASTPFEYLVNFCFIPVGSVFVSYLGVLSITNTSISNSLTRESAISERVEDCVDTSENNVVGGELSTSRSVMSLSPVARIAN